MKAIGAVWEDAALAELVRRGLTLIVRNWHCRHGELDLVMRDRDGGVVFVEVRFRGDGMHGDGVESVAAAKRGKLVKTAREFLAAHPAFARAPCRFDIVAFSGGPHNPTFEWLQNAFDAGS
jgi:putative endonuclease